MRQRKPNRFLDRTKPVRVAAIVTARFPEENQTFAYEQIHRQSLLLDADLRFFACETTDPRYAAGRTKAWLGLGMVTPPSDLVHAADVDHFRRTAPERFDRLLHDMAEIGGMPSDDLLQIQHVRIAISVARWMKAWAPDVLYSYYAIEGSLWAHVAATLLDIPRVLVHYGLRDGEVNTAAPLLPLHVRDALAIVVPSPGVADQLRTRFGPTVDAKLVCMETTPVWESELARRVAAHLRKRPPSAERTDLGAKASFLTAPLTLGGPPPITPFLIGGAERTGSNLLVDMLDSHPHVVSAGELFNTRLIEERRLDTQLSLELDAAEVVALRTASPAACHSHILDKARARGARACGFKLLYYHAQAENRIIDHLSTLPELRVVHLLRQDALARWISQVRAESSDAWWSGAQPTTGKRPGRIVLDPFQALLSLEFTEQAAERFHATFAVQPNVRMLELDYEEMVADFDGTAARVQELLGMDRHPLLVQFQKMGEKEPRAQIDNWDELVDCFADTRWRHLFQPL